jgi:hypothetical protein
LPGVDGYGPKPTVGVRQNLLLSVPVAHVWCIVLWKKGRGDGRGALRGRRCGWCCCLEPKGRSRVAACGGISREAWGVVLSVLSERIEFCEVKYTSSHSRNLLLPLSMRTNFHFVLVVILKIKTINLKLSASRATAT